MSAFIKQAADLIDIKESKSLAYLSDAASAAKSVWQTKTLPNRNTEDWKYTNLRAIEKGDFTRLAKPLSAQELQELASTVQSYLNIDNLNGHRLVFVNGYYAAELSHINEELERGIELVAFSKADSASQDLIKSHLDSVSDLDKHTFSSLNTFSLQDGILFKVNKNCVVQKPVHVVHISTGAEHSFSVNQRALVVLEANAQATIVEHFVSTDDSQNCFVNSVTELCLGENTHLNHYRLHEEQEDIIHIGGVYSRLEKSSVLNSFNLALGSKIKRIDFVVNHAGEGAHCELNGVYLPRHKQHVDYHTCIEHAVPHCTTNEVFRGIISDSARAVFNGRIHIHKDAQKTLAQLSNKNLLTSNKAEVDTKPELEIYADDVQCAHGATVAQLDTESLHYFKTRGIPEDEAMVMLSFGFINELVNDIKHDAISHYLRPKLAKLFAIRPELASHIL